jgi:hypothetical protein
MIYWRVVAFIISMPRRIRLTIRFLQKGATRNRPGVGFTTCRRNQVCMPLSLLEFGVQKRTQLVTLLLATAVGLHKMHISRTAPMQNQPPAASAFVPIPCKTVVAAAENATHNNEGRCLLDTIM